MLQASLVSFLIPYNYAVTEANILTKIIQVKDPSYLTKDFSLSTTKVIGGYNFFSQVSRHKDKKYCRWGLY